LKSLNEKQSVWEPNQRGKIRDFHFGAISFELGEGEGKNLTQIQANRGEIGKLQIQVE